MSIEERDHSGQSRSQTKKFTIALRLPIAAELEEALKQMHHRRFCDTLTMPKLISEVVEQWAAERRGIRAAAEAREAIEARAK